MDLNSKKEKFEVYLFDLGMNVRSSVCGKIYKPQTGEQNILVLVTFQGRLMLFDIDTLLNDKLLLENYAIS